MLHYILAQVSIHLIFNNPPSLTLGIYFDVDSFSPPWGFIHYLYLVGYSHAVVSPLGSQFNVSTSNFPCEVRYFTPICRSVFARAFQLCSSALSALHPLVCTIHPAASLPGVWSPQPTLAAHMALATWLEPKHNGESISKKRIQASVPLDWCSYSSHFYPV